MKPIKVNEIANVMGFADANTHIQVKKNAHPYLGDGSAMDGKQIPSPTFTDMEANSTSFGELKTVSAMNPSSKPGRDDDKEAQSPIMPMKKSFVNVVADTKSVPKVNFRTLNNDEKVDDSDFVLPMDAITGLRISLLIQSLKIIKDDDGFYFFKFASKTGVDQVLEQGPWMIRNTPIILTKWSANLALTKDKVTKVPVWVKMHKVPVVAYYEDGLSLIATQVGRPIMLDTFTSEKCADPWGRLGFARALIEVGADKELKQEVTMAIHNEDEQQVNKQEKEVEEDGFTSVSHRRKKGKQHTNTNQKQSDGLKMNKPKVRVVWQKTNQIAHKLDKEASDMDDTNMVKLKNNFNVLQNQDNMFNENNVETSGTNKVPSIGCDSDTPSAGPNKEDNWFASRTTKTTDNDSDSEDIEELILEDPITKDIGSKSEKGGSRIIVGWNPSEVDLMLISQDDQVVRGLWSNLAMHKHYIWNMPWSLLGDFNAALNLDDKSMGSSNFDISIWEFKECVEDIEVSNVNYTGLKYTWNHKPQGDDDVLKKIDRIMANLVFYDSFVGAYTIFQPYRISDHASAILKIPMISNVKQKTFKFSNVVKKLKHLKKPLRKLLYDQGNIHQNVKRLRTEVDEVQLDLDKDPSNLILCEEEAVYVKAYNDALLMEERFLKQKEKID
ncbi:trichome birefringence-like protein 3 [Tanacetum coccineum]